MNTSKKWIYDYDYMGWRVRERRVTCTNNSPVTWGTTADIDRKFVWDGWLMVEELDGLQGSTGVPPVIGQYTWGLDLAGLNGSVNDRTSAGGIGGLLGMYDTNGTSGTTADDKSYHYFYDANGNVGQVIDLAGTGGGANLAIAVKYEYDPYGNRVNTPGGGELDQPFRFSTKYFDAQTAMYYYGYRYYLPGLGRWGSRDPIESTEWNVYAAFWNSSINFYDQDGRQTSRPAVTVSAKHCGKWTLQDGTVLDIGQEIQGGIQKVCDWIDSRIESLWKDPETVRKIEGCLNKNAATKGMKAADIKAMMDRVYESACKKPRQIECSCNNKFCKPAEGGKGPFMVTPPTTFGTYGGQPIIICTCNLTNPHDQLNDKSTIWHELLRWWIGDSPVKLDTGGEIPLIEQWDTVVNQLDRCWRELQLR